MVSVKKVFAWLLIAFVIFYVLTAPQSSAELIRSAAAGLGRAADSLSEFVTTLV